MKACQGARLTIVAPSRWLAGLAKESPIHGHLDVNCIPNGIETDIFRPLDRAALRQRMNIPQEVQVLLVLGEARKGTGRLARIFSGLAKDVCKNLYLIMVGDEIPAELVHLLGVERTLSTGYVASPERMAELYGVSDLFLLPTEADNLPNTLLESISCGTPAVTFNVGGCPDVIRHLKTGYVAKVGDDADFAAGIGTLLQDKALLDAIRVNCRRLAEDEYSVEVATGRYYSLYKSLVPKR
jgi:glycosyltransferase involved in cell wall biosynthesis